MGLTAHLLFLSSPTRHEASEKLSIEVDLVVVVGGVGEVPVCEYKQEGNWTAAVLEGS